MILNSDKAKLFRGCLPRQMPAVAGALYPGLYSPAGKDSPVFLMHDLTTGTVVLEDQNLAPEERPEHFADRFTDMQQRYPLLQLWIGELELVQED